jgi:pimeloyl-ACP methyl ester carboxylesterase
MREPTVDGVNPMTATAAAARHERSCPMTLTLPKPDAAGADAVRPFTFHATDEELADLRRRVEATRWPDREPDASQGVRLDTIQALAAYWAKDYDYRAFERRFAALPHFITTIDGVDIHFIHVRSKHEDALPIVVTHGWPGSTVEQLKLIGPLTDPTANGGTAGDAFHLVIPSLPGHGFSGKPTVTGWDPQHIAKAWVELMRRLGYTRYVAQGGDWGNAVTEQLALLKPAGLLGIHTNMPATLTPEISRAVQTGGAKPAGLTPEESRAFDILSRFFATGTGYAGEMGHRPQTLYGIVDSPIGLAAWMLDHDEASYALIARAFAGNPGGISRDDVLDNVTHYWLTNSGISSARLYWESHLGFFDIKGVELPVGVTVFPDELYPAPRSWAERAYPRLVHYNTAPAGGHFAAWEQPATLAAEIRATFGSLR